MVALCAEREAHLTTAMGLLALHLPPVAKTRAPNDQGALFAPADCALVTWEELDHFDRATTALPASRAYLGPIWQEAPAAQATAAPTAPAFAQHNAKRKGPKVLCYLNLVDKRYDLLWQALAQRHANVLVLSPSGVPRACEAVRAWGVTVVQGAAPLALLLAQCDAVIGHGGMGWTSMALQAGKPALLLPEQAEQGLLATRLVHQRLAVATVRLRDKRGTQGKVAQLLGDERLHTSVASLSAKYRGFTPQQAVNRVAAQLLRAAEGLPRLHPISSAQSTHPPSTPIQETP